MIRVKFERTIYHNPEKSYSVNVYKVVEGDEKCSSLEFVTATGFYLSNYKDIVCELEGEWVNNSYGLQYKVQSCVECLSSTEAGIKAFLNSGMLTGVGPKIAEAMYMAFKEETLNVIEKEPEKLEKVKGILARKARTIHDAYMSNKYAKEIIAMVTPHGFSVKMALKVYKTYGEDAVNIIKNNPYKLCEIKGFGFITVDKMALIAHVSKESPDRIRACINHILTDALNNKGHLSMNIPDVRQEVVSLLNTPGVSEQTVHAELIKMIQQKKIVLFRYKDICGDNKEIISLPHVFQAETEAAQNIARLFSKNPKIDYDIDEEIRIAEKELGLTLDKIQKQAVKYALLYNVMVITGSPGTGKTTVLAVFDYIYMKKNPKHEILYCAPTGRAARRISESTGKYAITVHKATGVRGNEAEDEEYEEYLQEIDHDVVVVDEVSMLDVFLAKTLFKAIATGKKLLLVGDSDQLPSVGPGLVLYDIIKSKSIPVVELQTIFRQNEDSNIYSNIKAIKNGNAHLNYGSDFNYYAADQLDTIEDLAVKLYVEKVKKYGLMEVAYLTPFRNKAAGVNNMNKRLQEIINPPAPEKQEFLFRGTTYRVGDIVMELKNREEVSNGDVGTIVDIRKYDNTATIIVKYFDSLTIKYEEEDLEKLALAYAMTIHKSQGSQYKAVITCLTMAHMVFLKRNMPYTAFSRAKQDVSFLGSKKALAIAVSKQEKESRQTAMAYKIKYYCKMYGCMELDSVSKMDSVLNASVKDIKQLSLFESIA